MTRYDPECVDGTLFLVAGDDVVEVGAVDDIVAAIGGETYPIEYDEKQQTQPWLDTNSGALEIDVPEAATELSHTEELVSELCTYDMEADTYGLPTRTVEFANELVDILEQQGNS